MPLVERDGYEFDLIASPGQTLSLEKWQSVEYFLLEFQPARRVRPAGDPPTAIHVEAVGTPCDIAPGLLAKVEELVGCQLRFEASDG